MATARRLVQMADKISGRYDAATKGRNANPSGIPQSGTPGKEAELRRLKDVIDYRQLNLACKSMAITYH